MVFTSPHADITVPPLDLPTFLFSYAEQHSVFGTQPDLPAYIDDDVIISYAELKHMASTFAAGLVNKLRLKPQDHVALVLPNTAFYGILVLGTHMAGCVCVTTNPLNTSSELAHQFRMTQTKAVVTTMGALATLADSHIMTIDGNEDNFRRACSSRPFPHAYIATKKQATTTPALVVFSSGTQGLPKGTSAATANDPVIAEAERERKPRATIAGYTQVVMRRFDVEEFCALDAAVQTDVCSSGAACLCFSWQRAQYVKNYDLSSLVYLNCGAAPLGRELQDEGTRAAGCVITNAYGLSEASPVTHRSQIHGTPVGSAGVLLASMECKIVDDGGKELGAGQQGEICIRGPNLLIATASCHTGDIGYVDSSGYYFVTDRKKELIKYNGFQRSLAIPDAKLATEIPKAFVVVRPEHSKPGIAMDVREWVDDRVAYYKKLRGGVAIVKEIPNVASSSRPKL
ncbi:acetyl-CoA synthetase-like protein [Linderina pennispora]|uniref:Acetyl-CoA synthetase-like protein n=1 Tax=Linderina pennispora TaxID=61395 RepID=A0A1Y1WF56_9FUNG|nr:acetyl-CoA synthetase-like protein [Linderina pennispora]ORX71794.1 acetyl-CoA synthetase-like protein [Linderina pennispora]